MPHAVAFRHSACAVVVSWVARRCRRARPQSVPVLRGEAFRVVTIPSRRARLRPSVGPVASCVGARPVFEAALSPFLFVVVSRPRLDVPGRTCIPGRWPRAAGVLLRPSSFLPGCCHVIRRRRAGAGVRPPACACCGDVDHPVFVFRGGGGQICDPSAPFQSRMSPVKAGIRRAVLDGRQRWFVVPVFVFRGGGGQVCDPSPPCQSPAQSPVKAGIRRAVMDGRQR